MKTKLLFFILIFAVILMSGCRKNDTTPPKGNVELKIDSLVDEEDVDLNL